MTCIEMAGKGVETGRSVLFLDKVLLSPRRKDPRGVEVFNLNLLADLDRMGLRVTAAVHESWLDTARVWAPGGGIEWLAMRGGSERRPPGFWVARRLGGRRFDVLLLANVANRLTGALLLLRMLRVAPRCVLIAHREPSRRNLFAQSFWPTRVVAVNGQIAGHFLRRGIEPVVVRYGITHADRFHPAEGARVKDTVDFCVTGHLDSAWKGSDTAVAAFLRLPDAVRRRCRLHLASFHSPPRFDEPNILPYEWMDFKAMPDFLRKMDAMLVPSRDEVVMRETFSQAMVQGMLTGLPIVVNELPVLTEKLDKGGGLIYRTVDELTSAMQRLADDPERRRRLGGEARRTALERYVWDTGQFVRESLFPGENA